MALLDREHNLIVLRIVYDGPPEVGKTTSLRALAGSLGQSLFSPEEQDGRTLYLDWMDYTGGRFEGYQIRCQIVSVPGQRELARRRRHLLRDADVVVFVADSTRAHLEPTLALLGELPALIAGAVAPPVGVILQANKRDLPDAVPLPELRARLREAGLAIGVVESVAADGEGIRETFVFAVRLALDRVREQLRAQTLPVGLPVVGSGQELLDELKRSDGRDPPRLGGAPASPLIRKVLAENDDRQLAELAPWREALPGDGAGVPDGPLPPDPTAPSGAIWPPVEGRLILHEAAPSRLTTHRLRNGSWAAGLGNGWRTYSSGSGVFADLEVGREMLISWARLHAACAGLLSPSRCIVLAGTGTGSWRLWQIVRAERSLRDHLDDIDRCTSEEAAARILEVATLLSEMNARLAGAPCSVRCSLDTVGRGERGPTYIGLMPIERGPAPVRTELIGWELEALFNDVLYDRRAEVLAALARLPRSSPLGHGTGVLDRLLGGVAAG